MNSALYIGSVVHHRLRPKPHRFRYRLFWLLLDLDELDEVCARLKLLSHNRFNVFSFFDRDHGRGGAASLREQVDRLLCEKGIDVRSGPIRLVCMPRTLGYSFNPLSIYFCESGPGALAAIIYEVHNTFGERHSYILPASSAEGSVRHSCTKTFFVSPFMPMGLRYAFAVTPPADDLKIAISASDRNGVVLRAALIGHRRDLTDSALLQAGLKIPVEAAKTTVAIHWEALRLLLKGVPYLGRQARREA